MCIVNKPTKCLALLYLLLLSALFWESFPSYADNNRERNMSQETSTRPKHKPTQASLITIARGKNYFDEHRCASCHSVGTRGGCLGPPLLGIKSRRSKQFILSRITDDPREIARFAKLYNTIELMPHPRLPTNVASAVVSYLMTLPNPASGFKVGKHSQLSHTTQAIASQQNLAGSNSLNGKKLFYEHGCAACHSVGGIGGQFAPALDGIGNRRSLENIVKHITKAELLALGASGEYQGRGTVMPPSNLTPIEVQAIAKYLTSLPVRAVQSHR